MTKHSVISARIDAETLELVDKIVAQQGRSRAWFVAQAVRHAAGRVVNHADVLKMMDDMIAGHEAR